MPQNSYYLELRTHYLFVPYFSNERRIRVLLPRDYFKNERHYPVLYMHDGQNVFYSREAFAGYSWKVIPLIKQHLELPQMIIVGIDNSAEHRLDEYSPWKTEFQTSDGTGYFGGLGRAYVDWLVDTVKPFIDKKYRTLPQRETTLLAGSSMGGYITAYAGSLYPEIFGNLGVFSSAAWLNQVKFTQFITSHPLHPGNKVYIQTGASENDAGDDEVLAPEKQAQAYIDESLRYYQTLLRTGHPMDHISLNIFAAESHSEFYWAKHFPEFLNFVFNE